MSLVNCWARNAQLARHANVSVMTVWRWKQQPDFPPAAVVNGIEYNDLDAFDAWMARHIARGDADPTRRSAGGQNLRRAEAEPTGMSDRGNEGAGGFIGLAV